MRAPAVERLRLTRVTANFAPFNCAAAWHAVARIPGPPISGDASLLIPKASASSPTPSTDDLARFSTARS
jgi:hypothetical protein